MILKKFKPTTPGSRFRISSDYSTLTTSTPYKQLLESKKSTAGRNRQGRICMWHKGGGHKKRYRIIDTKRNLKDGMTCVVETIEYDPNRSAFIALVLYEDGSRYYILAPTGIKVGDKLTSGPGSSIQNGNALPVKEIPLGVKVHNLEMRPGKGGQIAKSAGSYATISSRISKYTIIKLPSKVFYKINNECRATIGSLSNPTNKLISLGKAGASRWRGIRPTVRGAAMNPIDHPHGGGEGKFRGSKILRSPWGLNTKGLKTRKNKRTTQFIIKK